MVKDEEPFENTPSNTRPDDQESNNMNIREVLKRKPMSKEDEEKLDIPYIC